MKKQKDISAPVVKKRKGTELTNGYETLQQVLDKVECEHIAKTLEFTDWNLQKSSRLLDIARNTLKTKIKKYRLD
jgi:transcriptional regulator of acetoin/glycerol metabolism